MKPYQCLNCKQEFQMETNVERKLKTFDNGKEVWGYYLTCPICGIDVEIALYDLPYKILATIV